MNHTLVALDLNIFQKKFKNSWATKISQQIFIEYYWLMVLSKRAVCDSKKQRFIKEQENSGLLSNLD